MFVNKSNPETAPEILTTHQNKSTKQVGPKRCARHILRRTVLQNSCRDRERPPNEMHRLTNEQVLKLINPRQ